MRGLASLCVVLSLAGCGDGGTPPGPAPTRLAVSGVPADAETTVPLRSQPVVQVTDAQGRAAPAITTVTAEVVAGNGTVVAGGTATTDASGRAAFTDLTLGASGGQVGPVSLRFSAPGLEAATATVALRCAVIPVATEQTIARSLTTGDCTLPGHGFVNEFELTTSQAVTAVDIRLNAPFCPGVFFRGPSEPRAYAGQDTDVFDVIGYVVLLPAGRTRIAAASCTPGSTGAYTLRLRPAGENVCGSAWVASPIAITTQQRVGDCPDANRDYFYFGFLRGASVTASVTTQAFAPVLHLETFGGRLASATGQGSAALTFTNESHDQSHWLVVTPAAAGGGGDYTLSINIASPPASTAAASQGSPPITLTRGSPHARRRR